jgi:hypothetical protein
MLVIRPNQVLAKRLKVTLAPLAQDSTNALGVWYCQLLYTKPRQLILAVSEKSRLVSTPSRCASWRHSE